MAEYYAVERSPEYLAHYGVRGMKWGVRKAIKRGDNARLSKAYQKAVKKLGKLSLNANQGVQKKIYSNAKRNMAVGAVSSAGISAGLTAAANNHTSIANRAKYAGIVATLKLLQKEISGVKTLKKRSREPNTEEKRRKNSIGKLLAFLMLMILNLTLQISIGKRRTNLTEHMSLIFVLKRREPKQELLVAV